MKTLRSRYLDGENQQGINMVDLMMWLVIAALLLAAAIQGIGYYQKGATLYSMKNDALHAGEAVLSRMSSTDGITTDTAVADATTDSAKTSNITTTADPGASDANGFVIRSSSDSVDYDVLYLSDQRGSYSPGINIVPKGTMIQSDGSTTTMMSPSTSTSASTVVQPTVDTSNVMTTVWDTRLTTDANFDTSNPTPNMVQCTTISVPLAQTVDATINWGDGTPDTVVKSDYNSTAISHTYSDAPGLHTVKVTGTFQAWVGWDWINWTQGCVTNVTSWGDGTGTSDGTAAFYGAANITDIARIPLTMTVLDTFADTISSNFTGDSMSKWDVSHVTNMQGAFADNANLRGDMSNWDVSNVDRFNNTFSNTTLSSDISNWNVSNGYTFAFMFSQSTFNGDISNWNTSGAQNMAFMFAQSKFNGNISNWNVSSVTDMGRMFDSASFNGDISNWNVSKVTGFSGMFWHNNYTGDLSKWNTSSGTMFSYMFADSTFNGDISNWNFSQAQYVGSMFQNNTAFNRDISKWNTGNAADMTQMFNGASAFNQNLSGWNVANVTTYADFGTGSALTAGHLPLFK